MSDSQSQNPSPSLRTRFEEHLSRKFFHFFSGSLISYVIVAHFERLKALAVILFLVIFLGAFDLLRLKIPFLNRWVLRLMGPLMRQGEEHKLSAQFYYLLGLAFAVALLPKPVAIQAILTLAWMDPVAAVIGTRLGKTKWVAFFEKYFSFVKSWPRNLDSKSVEGSLAGFVAAVLAGVVAWTGYWAAIPLKGGGLAWPLPQNVFLFCVVGAVAAMVAEAWPSQWDDNVNIPVWTGIVVWALTKILGQNTQF